MWMWMVVVPAVVKVIVAAARVEAVAVERMWRGCLDPVAAEYGQREERDGKAGSDQERHVRERAAAAPP